MPPQVSGLKSHPSKVLLTGVSGFVGQKLAAQFLAAGHAVIGIDLRAGSFRLQNA